MFEKYPEISTTFFNKVYIECYARVAFHSELEGELKKTKACKNLSEIHLKKILSDEHWNYSRTWGFPSDDQITELVKEIRDDIRILNENPSMKDAEIRVLDRMVKTIKNIEIVSIILAFLIPERYCIIAPPPEHLIGFRRNSDKVETLLRYFSDLRLLAEHYNMGVFEIEKALWTIHQLRYKIPYFDKALTEELWENYLNEPKILGLRVKNLLNELWGDSINDDFKSKILKEKDPGLALILAMRYLESNMWKLVKKTVDKDRLENLESSAKEGNILTKLMVAADTEPVIRTRVDRIRRKRNLAMHPTQNTAAKISSIDVEEAIELNKLLT